MKKSKHCKVCGSFMKDVCKACAKKRGVVVEVTSKTDQKSKVTIKPKKETENKISEVDKHYNELWKDLVEKADGSLDLERVKKNFYNLSELLQEAMTVYKELTNGAIQGLDHTAEEIILEINDYYYDEFRKDLRDYLEQKKQDKHLSLTEYFLL